MMKDVMVAVDLQNDFVTGSLGTPEAQAIAPKAAAKARDARKVLVFTKDTHHDDYSMTQEGKLLPVSHCIKGTSGWELIPELDAIQKERDAIVFEKGAFASRELAEHLARMHQKGELSSVELFGLCTDICVISNALLIKAYMPELPVYVDASCCAGVSPEKHEAALSVMESCQIIVRR